MNMSPKNKAHFEAEKEAIHLILTGIRDGIYSTVNACQTAQEIWEAIERLQQDMKANPLALVTTAQANQDSYYQTSKSHKSHAPSSKPSILTRSHTTTRQKGKEIAKPITSPSETASEEDSDTEQAQRDKDMQKNLALIAKYFKKIYKPTNNNLRTSSNLRNKNVDTTPRYKNDNQSGQFGNQRTVNVAGARENVGSLVVQQSRIQCFNCKEFGHFAKECRKPKRVKDFAYHKENMLLCKQAEQGVPLQAEQYDWLADTDEEIDEQEFEAHYSYIAKIQEVPTANTGTGSDPVEQVQNDAGYNVFSNDLQYSEQSESISNTCLVETDYSNVILDSPDMCEDNIQNDQNDIESDDKRVALANLIANLKLDVDKNKKIQKQLKKANTTLAQELKECKAILAETNALDKLQCLYLHKVKECECLAQKLSQQTESVSKEVYTKLLKRFAKEEKHSISLKIALQKHKEEKKVASKTTNQKPHSYFRMLYEKTSKTWKWWIEEQSPSGYKWVPNTKMQWVPKAQNDHVQKRIVQLILFIFDSGCTKHMTGNLKLLCNFIEKFMGLNHNLLSFGQFCDADLEVAFRKSTCFVRDFQGNDLLTGNCGYDLYIISLQESTSSTPLCLMAKASPTQAWLWHRRLSHLNFDYINLLLKKDIVFLSSKGRLNLLHIDLCGLMRVASINEKKCILVIVDDYYRYTWTLFLRSKDETLEVLKEFLTMIQRNLQALVITVRTDSGTEFLNKTLSVFFKEKGIEHQTSNAQTPEQNGVVKRRNRSLVEAAPTMLSVSKLPLFFWAEATTTACYTQNRSIIILNHDKTPYHIINGKKPLIKHLHIFGWICYITRDGKILDKMNEKEDPCILVGYSTQSKGYRVYNKRTRMIVESIHI
nr:hypothetical protein [Tanacetum cinerariifolium]